MKQQITQQQYDSLSTQSKSKYAQWIVDNEKKHGIHRAEYDVEYWTIDNMILFIDDHIEEGWWNIERECDKTGYKTGWSVQHGYIDFNVYDVPELIDALWSAVKVLLREDDERSI